MRELVKLFIIVISVILYFATVYISRNVISGMDSVLDGCGQWPEVNKQCMYELWTTNYMRRTYVDEVYSGTRLFAPVLMLLSTIIVQSMTCFGYNII